MPASGGVDLLVRGAGPVGCAAALALRAAGFSVALRGESAPAGAFRPIALSYASRLILERLDAWRGLDATPIETVRVTQAGGFGRTRLDAADAGVPALGYVTAYGDLLENLRRGALALFVDEDVPARCTVHAEGWSDEAAETEYGQHALVARVRTVPPANTTAFERFTPEGPLALLPMGARYALIWSMRPARAAELAGAGQASLVQALAEAMPRAAGVPQEIDAVTVQPLRRRVRSTMTGERAVYIGNAAQTLHPVAGQGLNLGLRDAWDLAQSLRGCADAGDAAALARYAALRRVDAAATARVTDWLARGFLGSSGLTRAARGVALAALDIFPAPRRFFARRMIFGNSALP